MKTPFTAGFDIALLFNERLLNEISAALFYSGFLTINGTLDLSRGMVKVWHKAIKDGTSPVIVTEGNDTEFTEVLSQFSAVDFRFKLTREPIIDFYLDDGAKPRLRISVGLRAYFTMWGSFEIKFDLTSCISTGLELDSDSQLTASFKSLIVEDLTLSYGNNTGITTRHALDNVATHILLAYFEDDTFSVPLRFPGMDMKVQNFSVGIPDISVDAFKLVSDTTLAIGINTCGDHYGREDELYEFAKNCSVGFAMNENSINKLLKYLWDKSSGELRISNHKMDISIKKGSNVLELEGNMRVDFNFLTSDKSDFWEGFFTKVVSLGFYVADWDFYELQVYFPRLRVDLKDTFPRVNFISGNMVSVEGLDIDISATISVDLLGTVTHEIDPLGWLDFFDIFPNIVVKRDNLRLAFQPIFPLDVFVKSLKVKRAVGEIRQTRRGALELILKEFIFDWEEFDFKCHWNSLNVLLKGIVAGFNTLLAIPAYLSGSTLSVEGIVKGMVHKKLTQLILDNFPKITLSPELSFDIPMIPWPLTVGDYTLTVTDTELKSSVRASFEQFGKRTGPVPKYIVNDNTRQVHKIGCSSLTDIYEQHQRSYYLLSDAIDDGYDGCRNCLPAFHKK